MTATAAPSRRRRLGWLGWSVLVVLAVLVITVVGLALAQTNTNSIPLHPANPGLDGTMALHEVLDDHEVTTRTVSDHQALQDAAPGPDDTVVITNTERLDPAVARHLVPTLQRAGRVVVVADDFHRLTDLRLPVSYLGPSSGTDPVASCRGDVVPGDVEVAGLTGAFDLDSADWRGCFSADEGHALTFGPYGQATAVVIDSTGFATNDHVLEADNAQAALWLYGSESQVLWYMPSYDDTLGGGKDADEVTLAPAWFTPVLVLLGFAVLTLMIAQGRRFGPLSREPMPVVVSALETTRIRGRLYRGTDDLAHSAGLLRTAAVGRLARRTGLPPNADAGQVADRLGATHPQAPALLTGPLPSTPDEAVRWWHDLQHLEDEVADD